MPDRKTRVIRAVFQSPPDPDRFSGKEWGRYCVVVLFPDEVKLRLATTTVAVVERAGASAGRAE